ncbi:helix-turn-helix domain-containing protein [Chitinophaga sp. GCM10012297]|uniref:Helix-turn-helix transcriptional regulator n=1 Tax=Chitinophaga chungangae TaxID=2821488 RepID=A0ABS3YBV3_9BACT|nr:AraC family transcriptional regulator [Chitinophaga chungangae]MBO9152163.1 helix-turn-helix transcriptional regulator [Chitinophaga chungangae]
MKNNIPVLQIKENISGVHIEKITDTVFESLYDSVGQLHRNDHNVCILLNRGSIELMVDFKNFALSPQTLLFLQPGQIQRMVCFGKNSDGWILFLDNKLIDEHARLMIEEALFNGPLVALSPADVLWFTRYFELLYQTYYDEALDNFHKPAVNALVVPGIFKVAAAFRVNARSAAGAYSQRSIELTINFKRLVRKHYRELKKPNDYAELMNLSISYLNDTIKSVTGFTASYFIQQEMLREGQRLLCYSDQTIKEIAAYLGYDDAKYFNRIFTKLAKISPGRFRSNFKSNKTMSLPVVKNRPL